MWKPFRVADPVTVLILSFALLLFLSTVCGAQPGDVLDPLPPDYDQVRSGLPVTPYGIPGGAYCGPTSAADLLKWLNENGYPAVGDWGPSTNDVTDAIYEIGVATSTDSWHGADDFEFVTGIQSILDDAYPLQFCVAYYGRCWEDPTMDWFGRDFTRIASFLDDGALVIARIGWYHLNPPAPGGAGDRCNGHYVAITGYDLDSDGYWVRFVDPAQDIDCQTHGQTCVARWLTSLENLVLADSGSDPTTYSSYRASRWHWERDGNSCSGYETRTPVQDGFHLITEGVCYTLPEIPLLHLLEFSLARAVDVPVPAGLSEITSIAVSPTLDRLYHCGPGTDIVFSTDLTTELVEVFPAAVVPVQPRQIACGRTGIVYVLHGSPGPAVMNGDMDSTHRPESGLQLTAYTPDGSLVASIPVSGVGAFTYHEKTDRIYWWNGTAGRLQAYSANLEPEGQALDIPSGPDFGVPAYLAAEPNGDVLYFNHDGSDLIYRFDLAAGSPLSPLADPDLTDPAAMALTTRGDLVVVQQFYGPLLHFDAAGNRLTESPAYAVQGRRVLALNRPPLPPVPANTVPGDWDNDPPIWPVGSTPDGIGLTNGAPIMQAVPNPCNPTTEIRFDLAVPTEVTIEVFDTRGRLVRSLVVGRMLPAGPQAIPWDGTDTGGRPLASGIYVCRLLAGANSSSLRLAVLR